MRGRWKTSSSERPKSSIPEIICSSVGKIVRPPAAPMASQGRPFRASTSGHMLASGLAPAAMLFGCPGRGSNHIMPLFMMIPACGSATRAPKRESSVFVSETMVPCLSTTLTWEVQPACGVAA